MTLHLEKGLIVENNESDAKLFTLSWPECRWDIAPTVADAVALIDKAGNGYDIIILDLTLPIDVNATYSSGFQTIRYIRSASNAPIVLYTGDDLTEYSTHTEEYGIYGLIQKGSWTQKRVETIIERAVYKWQLDQVKAVIEEAEKAITSKREFRRDFLSHRS